VHLRAAAGLPGSPGPGPGPGPGAPGLSGVLDALVGRAVRVAGWERAVDLALDRPELVVVTAEGDRFADSGWRVRSTRGVVTAATVEEAADRAAAAATAADAAAERLDRARRELEEASAADVVATRALDRHEADRVTAAAERARTGEDRARVAAEIDECGRGRAESAAGVDADATALEELERAVPDLEAKAGAAVERAEAAARDRAELDGRRAEVDGQRRRLEVGAAGVAERQRVLERRHAEVERRLAGHAEEREAAAARRVRLEADGVAVDRLGAVVGRERARLEAVLDALRTDYRQQVERIRAGGERLEAIRRHRSVAEGRQAELGERSRRLDREVAEVSLRREALQAMVRTELGADPEEVVGGPAPDLPDGVGASEHAAALAGRLASLGPVNPLALDELSALEERHQELDAQMEDVRAARRELLEVARALDREIVETFAAASADVNEHFSDLVSTLFPGGTGRLTLTDPEDLLHTGVEVEVRPAGRNVRRVSLLSGGERSLAALAFLFAVFRSRPSPFYLMDEVEAALDDVNLHRFLGLVREFRQEAQLIVVSHQKRTMDAADALYGVTMAPGGSSQVVSQKVARPEEAAAAP
ncbi:MAG: AAA family ATPase, partial [Acidimicrobiales bacterium]